MSDDPPALAALRREIDALDREILARLNLRAERVRAVGEVKRAQGGGVYRAARERDLLRALAEENRGPFPSSAVPAVFREIISATYSLEGPLRVAYLGPPGTFSQLAARQTFGSQAEYLPVANFTEVLAAVERGDAQHGILPVENTSEGPVTQALDALLETRLPICGERLLRISLQLFSRAESLDALKLVASHPQALAQARGWLDRALPEAERVPTPSTAAAAERALGDATVAAIGSEILSEQGAGLRVLAKNIEDDRENTTRFLILGGEAPPPSGADATSVAYTVHKAEAGALVRLLEPFAEHAVNLQAIHARPLRGTPWEYVFFIDVEGHIEEPRVRAACEAAAQRASSYRVLGAFPRAACEARR